MSQNVPKNARLEIKFVAFETEQHKLLEWISLHPVGFSCPYPDRIVNNVYFDTHSYTTYAENLSGASDRTKIRYRWYGKSRTPDRGALEIKCKRNVYGWKHRYTIERPPYVPGDSWSRIRHAISAQLSMQARSVMNFLPMPVLINRYHRQYFLSADGLLRATIDTRQKVWDQRYGSLPNLHRHANMCATMVVEFKFHRENFELASRALQGIPIRVSRHSKYVVGVGSITSH